MEEVLNKAKYKIPSEAADKAFAMMNLGDNFRLDFREYREFYENLLKKLESQGSKKALTRDFNIKGEKMSRKISMSMKGAANRAGYRQLQDGTFDRTLGKSWEGILKRKSGRRGKKARKKRKRGGKKKSSPYANPKLRARIVAQVKAMSIGDGKGANASGGWSGNKAMIAAKKYKKAGGRYK